MESIHVNTDPPARYDEDAGGRNYRRINLTLPAWKQYDDDDVRIKELVNSCLTFLSTLAPRIRTSSFP